MGKSVVAPSAAVSPQTKDEGNAEWAKNEIIAKPLASPSAAESQASMIHGADKGAVIVLCIPKKVPSFTAHGSIGMNSQRLGIWRATSRIVSARLSVRALQTASLAHNSV